MWTGRKMQHAKIAHSLLPHRNPFDAFVEMRWSAQTVLKIVLQPDG